MAEKVEKTVRPEMQLSPQQAEAIQKAANFTTGFGITPDTQPDASALRPESLEHDVKTLTYTYRDFTIFPDIPRTQINSTVHKYPIKDQNGKVGHSRFTPEIGIASLNTPRLRQKLVEMRFLSDTKQMSLATGLVNNIQNPMQILEEDAMIVIAKTIEWAIFYGDADLTGQADSKGLEFDGLCKLIDPANIRDLRGKSLTPEIINQAAVIIGRGFGTPTDAYMPIGVHADFVDQHLKAQRVIVQNSNNEVQLGLNTTVFNSVRGQIKLHGSTIMDIDNILDETQLIDANAPFAPQAVTAAIVNAAGGKFTGAEDISAYNYKVVVVGQSYDSAPSAAVSATVTAATDAVELTITLSALQRTAPDYVAVYRQGKNSGFYFLIGRKAVSQAEVDGTIKFRDTNDILPETADVFIGELNRNVITLFEFLPMMKLNLAVVTSASQFSVLWYGALGLYAPRKWVRIKNVNYVQAYKDPDTYSFN